MVAIDDSLAFCGGIDMTDGRWDDDRLCPNGLLGHDLTAEGAASMNRWPAKSCVRTRRCGNRHGPRRRADRWHRPAGPQRGGRPVPHPSGRSSSRRRCGPWHVRAATGPAAKYRQGSGNTGPRTAAPDRRDRPAGRGAPRP
ncbi:hypothetical protein [uncultured Paracoccus sp.]|uniref:hypothetical protein n=1 Tax=uncultured Paracoccus sp. TaxID=189685 RepID=UPI0025E72A8C|nr:hypothetical protein [uncultured Paracoccus sp.]